MYPYEYMDTFIKFFEDELPNRREFFRSLKDKCIGEKDCLQVINVWNTFELDTMGDYHDLI